MIYNSSFKKCFSQGTVVHKNKFFITMEYFLFLVKSNNIQFPDLFSIKRKKGWGSKTNSAQGVCSNFNQPTCGVGNLARGIAFKPHSSSQTAEGWREGHDSIQLTR